MGQLPVGLIVQGWDITFKRVRSYVYYKSLIPHGADYITVEPLYCGHLGDLVKCPV